MSIATPEAIFKVLGNCPDEYTAIPETIFILVFSPEPKKDTPETELNAATVTKPLPAFPDAYTAKPETAAKMPLSGATPLEDSLAIPDTVSRFALVAASPEAKKATPEKPKNPYVFWVFQPPDPEKQKKT